MQRNLDREGLLRALRESHALTLEHFDASADERRKSYREGGWSVRMILAHLADAEFANLWRFHQSVAEPGIAIEPYDENRWAAALAYEARPNLLSRAVFDATRSMLIHELTALPPERLAVGAGEHPVKGRLSADDWCALIQAHSMHHLGQIEAARAGREWKPVETPTSWMYTGKPRPPDAGMD